MAFYDETATIPASTLLVDSPKSPKSKLFNPSKMSLALLLGHFARLLSDENDAIYKIFNERPSMKKYFYDTMRSLFDYNAKNTTTDNVLLQVRNQWPLLDQIITLIILFSIISEVTRNASLQPSTAISEL